jgi:putative phosphoesterase
MRVGILSDTHGFLDPRIIDIIHDCDLAVHAGDIGNAHVLQLLRVQGKRVMAVRGNNDTKQKWPREDRSALDALPDHLSVDLPGGCLVAVHGHDAGRPARRHATLRNLYPDARGIVYGHSHRLIFDRSKRPWVLNPGAAGKNRTFGGPSCLVLCALHSNWWVEVFRFPAADRHHQ